MADFSSGEEEEEGGEPGEVSDDLEILSPHRRRSASKRYSLDDLMGLVGKVAEQHHQTSKLVAASVALKSKRGERDDQPQESTNHSNVEDAVMIDENYHIKDDGQGVIDLKLRHRLRTPNADPDTWWTPATSTRISKPRLGLNAYTTHLALTKVSAITIRRMSDRGATLLVRHLLARNAGIEFSDDGAKR